VQVISCTGELEKLLGYCTRYFREEFQREEIDDMDLLELLHIVIEDIYWLFTILPLKIVHENLLELLKKTLADNLRLMFCVQEFLQSGGCRRPT
jgi:hypothetical protein